MWETAAQRIEEMGGQVLMKHEVTALEMKDGKVVAVRAKSPVGERRIEAQHFISTMPIKHLVRSFDPQPPAEIVKGGDGLNYRDFLTVAVMVDQEELFPDNWIYIHTPGVKVGRIQNFNNWSKAMVPRPGTTCLGLEYFCFEGDGLWNAKDEDLIALAKQELGQLGLVDPSKIFDGCVVRQQKAYPVYDSVYAEHLKTVRTHIDGIPNLHTVGRNGMHKYNNANHSMLTAMMAIANMRGAKHDMWAVNTDYKYP